MLECRDKSLYTGITNDVERRLVAHNGKKGGRYTRSRVPVRLVHLEKKRTRSSALVREAQIKCLTRQAKVQLIQNARR